MVSIGSMMRTGALINHLEDVLMYSFIMFSLQSILADMSGKSVQKLVRVLAGAGPGHLLREIGSWCGEWSIYISSASSVSRQTDMAAMFGTEKVSMSSSLIFSVPGSVSAFNTDDGH